MQRGDSFPAFEPTVSVRTLLPIVSRATTENSQEVIIKPPSPDLRAKLGNLDVLRYAVQVSITLVWPARESMQEVEAHQDDPMDLADVWLYRLTCRTNSDYLYCTSLVSTNP